MSALPAAFESPYAALPVALTEQRVAVARTVFGRFKKLQRRLGQLTAQTAHEEFGAALPFDRSETLHNVRALAVELVDFYNAVFTGESTTPHRASAAVEHQLNVETGTYLAMLGARYDAGAGRLFDVHAGLWQHVGRHADGLALFPLFAARLQAHHDSLALRLEQLGAVEAAGGDGNDADIVHRVRESVIEARDGIDAELSFWRAQLEGLTGELRKFMLVTQPRHLVAQASDFLERDAHAFAVALRTVDRVIERESAAADIDMPLESVNDALTRLSRLQKHVADVEQRGRAWITDLEEDVRVTRERFAEQAHDTQHIEFRPRRTTAPRVLAVYAHPDDETTAGGRVLAMLARTGYDVTVATATGGEAGRVQDPRLDQPLNHRDFAEIRNEEQGRANFRLGIQALVRLNFVDAGMRNDPSSHQQRIEHRFELLVDLVQEELERDRPQFVLTHPNDEEQAAYDHPDHKLVLKATVEAVGRHNALHPRRAVSVYAVVTMDATPVSRRFPTTHADHLSEIEAQSAYETQVPGGEHGAESLQSTPNSSSVAFTDVTPGLARTPPAGFVPQQLVLPALQPHRN